MQKFKSRFFALLWGGLSVFAALLLISYHLLDPSFNRAIDVQAHNLLGSTGSYFADPLLQFFGIAAGLIPALMLVWSVRCYLQQAYRFKWLRVFVHIICIVSAGGLAAIIIPIESWPFHVGLGGYMGDVLKNTLWELLTPYGYGFAVCLLFITGSIHTDTEYDADGELGLV